MQENASTGRGGSTVAKQQEYAGDINAREAWDMLKTDAAAVLVDVRTKPEWDYVGVPVLSEAGKSPCLLEWQSYPSMQVDPDFAASLEATGVPKDATVLFICRSGQRSRAAAIAATGHGFKRCFNVSGGFEGPPDGEGHRGRLDGWKALGLPWKQG